MRALLAVASLHKSYGGPAFSVSRLADALSCAGVKVAVWTPDGSAASSDLLTDAVTGLSGPLETALQKFGRPTLIHDNGIWLRHNHQLARLSATQGLPRIVSLRGMLEPWARRHKALKKAVAWQLYQRRDLKSAGALHATAMAEGDNLASLGLGPLIRVIPNGIDIAEPRLAPSPSADGPRVALFLGRIYPVKGLPMLVQAWAAVRPRGWKLRIAGPDEAGHRAEVEELVRSHGLDGVVEFTGPADADQKRDLFANAELFILPSHSESFGMAIGEALSHALPVLTTRAAPWPMLERRGAGWWVEPQVASLAEGLRTATSLSSATLQAMGQQGRALVVEDFSWPSAAAQMLSLYEQVASARITP